MVCHEYIKISAAGRELHLSSPFISSVRKVVVDTRLLTAPPKQCVIIKYLSIRSQRPHKSHTHTQDGVSQQWLPVITSAPF